MDISVADELIKLKALQEQGVISQEEFDLQKSKLLASSDLRDESVQDDFDLKAKKLARTFKLDDSKVNELAQKLRDKEKIKRQPISCTYCKSQNVQFMQNKKKGFSFKKFAAGNILGGNTTAATVAGFSGKSGKNEWYCNDCGRTFISK